MSASKLTKKEAIELISPVVDDEVDEDTRIAFFAYIQNDESVRTKYESMKRLKDVVSTRCPCASAPMRLKKRVQNFLEGQQTILEAEEELIYDVPCKHSMSGDKAEPAINTGTSTWQYGVAATLLIAALSFGLFMYLQSPSEIYNVEEYAYAHFIKHEGKMVQPTIATASPANAELELAHAFNMPMTVPPLKNAEFKGIVMNDFVPGFQTPMMEYYLPTEDQYIYIFGFKIDQLTRFEELVRSQDAVNSCVKAKDFHIRNVNGKHVVSWKWEDTWYAAISNHSGETLASLVEPLSSE